MKKGNKIHYASNGLMPSTLINTYTESKIYFTVIRWTVIYTYKTVTMFVQDINNTLLVFERQKLRKAFGPIGCKEGERIRNNNELENLVKEGNVECLKERGIKC
jgi:hypothetical protein